MAGYSRCCKMQKTSSLGSYSGKQKFKNHAELGQTLTLPFGGVCCPSFTCTNFKLLAHNLDTFLRKTCGFDFVSDYLIPSPQHKDLEPVQRRSQGCSEGWRMHKRSCFSSAHSKTHTCRTGLGQD